MQTATFKSWSLSAPLKLFIRLAGFAAEKGELNMTAISIEVDNDII